MEHRLPDTSRMSAAHDICAILGELPPGLLARLKIAVRGTIPPAISIADASAAENAAHLMFDVTLSRSFQNTVKVDFETISGGTATEGVDYHARRTYTHVILYGRQDRADGLRAH